MIPQGKDSGTVRVEDFQGFATDIQRAKLPPAKFQLDQGGDHFQRGSWRVRRGRRHTDATQAGDQIDTVVSFAIPGGSFATLVLEGGSTPAAFGFVDTDEST